MTLWLGGFYWGFVCGAVPGLLVGWWVYHKASMALHHAHSEYQAAAALLDVVQARDAERENKP